MPSVVGVECARIEKKMQPPKQHIYSLALHWSDGSVTEVEKPHSALIELRTSLKKDYYADKRDVHIPEVPSAKRFEIGTSSKKDERRKKSIGEFCTQLIQLPDVAGKVNPVMEFFTSQCFQDDGGYSDADLLASDIKESAKKGPSSQEKISGVKANEKKTPKNNKEKENNEKQTHGRNSGFLLNKDAPITNDVCTLYSEVNKPKRNTTSNVSYAEVHINKAKDKGGCLSPPATDMLYAEIGPTSQLEPSKTSQSVAPVKSQGGVKHPAVDIPQYSFLNRKMELASPSKMPSGSDKGDVQPFKIEGEVLRTGKVEDEEEKDDESNYRGPQYQNFPIPSKLCSDEQKFYLVTQSFTPDASCSQYLTVENGDLVEVQTVSADRVFCSLNGIPSRPLKGWLPTSILKPCHSGPGQESSDQTTMPPKPSVPTDDGQIKILTSATKLANEVQVIAVTDYSSQDNNVLSFEKGLVAELISQDDPDWWSIRTEFVCGWVPASCWQILPVQENMPAKTTIEASYFVGSLSRSACEELLLKHGKELNFIIRESSNLVGQFALSVKHNNHIHHFPIMLTEDNKYYIGKHRFKTIDNVITYYQRNDLFVDEDGSAVRLGNPLDKLTVQ